MVVVIQSGSIDAVVVAAANVGDGDARTVELVEVPDLEPVTSPVAPEALMRDWALFSLVQAII